MPEKPPTSHETEPGYSEPEPPHSIDEVVAANTVPPTEPPPHEDIEVVATRLHNNAEAHTGADAESGPDEHPATGNTTNTTRTTTVRPVRGGGSGGVSSRGHAGGHGKGKIAGMFGIVFASIGWFFMHVVVPAVKNLPAMWPGGSKPKASSGGGGGGHH